MRTFTRVVLVAAVLMISACASAPKAAVSDSAAAEKEITQRVQVLLERYSRNDQEGVVAMLDPDRFVVLGTNFNEKITSAAGLRDFMARDFAQWGSARFKDVREFDVRTDGTLATANFVFTFEPAAGPTLPIRGTTTWRKVNGQWLLTQSTSAVPPQF